MHPSDCSENKGAPVATKTSRTADGSSQVTKVVCHRAYQKLFPFLQDGLYERPGGTDLLTKSS